MSLNLVTIGYRFQFASFVGKVIAYAGFIENYPVSYFETPSVTIDGSPLIGMVSFAKRVKFISEGEADIIIVLDLSFGETAERFVSGNGTILLSNGKFKPVKEPTKKESEIYRSNPSDDKKIKKVLLNFESLPYGASTHLKKAAYTLGAFSGLNGYLERENLISSIEKHLPDSKEIYFDSFWKGYEEIRGKID